MKILDKKQIERKIQRLAIQIIENNFSEKEIILAGINNNGMRFADLMKRQLEQITDKSIILTQLRLDPAKPTSDEIVIGIEDAALKRKVIIIVDDVANTGRTIFYAFKPLMEIVPKKVETAVLVDRKHKSFPVKIDYVGLSLATTIQENIKVSLKGRSWLASLT